MASAPARLSKRKASQRAGRRALPPGGDHDLRRFRAARTHRASSFGHWPRALSMGRTAPPRDSPFSIQLLSMIDGLGHASRAPAKSACPPRIPVCGTWSGRVRARGRQTTMPKAFAAAFYGFSPDWAKSFSPHRQPRPVQTRNRNARRDGAQSLVSPLPLGGRSEKGLDKFASQQ